MYGLSFEKINVIIACYEDIFVRYSIKKGDNDQLHPQFAIIVFNIKRSLRFLVLETFITCFPPEKPRDIAFYPISP